MKKKFTLLSASALTVLAGTIISPAIPTMEKVLEPAEGISFIVPMILTITSLMIAITSPLAGYVIDKMGRKRLLMGSLILYALAGSAGLYLSTAEQILISRMILGFAVAGTMTGSTTLIADYFTGDEREKFLGYQMSFMALGGAIFLILSGLLASWWWRGPFIVYLLSLILVVPVWRYITEPELKKPQILEQGDIPYLTYGMIVLSGLFGMMLYFLIPTRVPFLLDMEIHLATSRSGFFMAASALFVSSIASRYYWFHEYFSKSSIYSAAFILLGLGLEIIAHVDKPWMILCGMAVTGMGFGFIIPNSTVWTSQIAPMKYRGRMIGGVSSAFFLGQFLSTLFGEPIFRYNGLEGTLGVFGIGGMLSIFLGLIHLLINIRSKPA